MARGSLTSRRETGAIKKKSKRDRGQEILDAAVDIFHANGYSATTIDDVANAVGILKGSLYYYINSKEDLLLRIVEEVHEEVEALMEEAVSRPDATPLERLAGYVESQVEYNALNVKRVRVYYHDYDQLSPDPLAVVRRRRRAAEQKITALLKEAKRAGEVPAGLDEKLASKSIFGSVIWMYTWFKPGGSASAQAYGSFCARFVLAGVRGGTVPVP